MQRFFRTTLISSALVASLMVPAIMQADPIRYHDARHKDDHEWNSHEDAAYKMWVNQRHRKYAEFNTLRASDQQAYWDWRHSHSDAVLKINIP